MVYCEFYFRLLALAAKTLKAKSCFQCLPLCSSMRPTIPLFGRSAFMLTSAATLSVLFSPIQMGYAVSLSSLRCPPHAMRPIVLILFLTLLGSHILSTLPIPSIQFCAFRTSVFMNCSFYARCAFRGRPLSPHVFTKSFPGGFLLLLASRIGPSAFIFPHSHSLLGRQVCAVFASTSIALLPVLSRPLSHIGISLQSFFFRHV